MNDRLRGGLASLGLQVAMIGSAFAVTAILSRHMGPENFGTYTYIFVLYSLAALPLSSGLRTLVIREIATAQVSGDRWRIRSVLTVSFRTILSVSAAIVMMTWLLSQLLESSEPIRTALIASVLVTVLAFVVRLGAILSGLGHTLLGQIPDQILAPVLFVASVLVFSVMSNGSTLTPSIAMTLQVLALAVTFLLVAPIVSRYLPNDPSMKSLPSHLPAWAKSLFILSLVSGLALINQKLDLLMIGTFLDSESVGIYRVAAQCAALVAIPQIAINRLIAPRITAFQERGDKAALQKLVYAASSFALIGAAPIAIMFALFRHDVIEVFFGSAFTPGANSIAILSLGYLASAALGSVGLILNMTSNENDTAKGMAIAALANVVLNYPLIKIYGIEGAAVATAISLFVWNAYLCFRVAKRLKVASTVLLIPWTKRP